LGAVSVSDWFLGIILTLHFLGAKNLGLELQRVLQPAAGPVRMLADYTFTLYLVHLPVLLFVGAVVGANNRWRLPMMLSAVILVTGLIGYFTEHQRHRLRRALEQWLEALSRRRLVSGAV
jgi:peptidoglycan/LPS O-acetylase OafA/YrhL